MRTIGNPLTGARLRRQVEDNAITNWEFDTYDPDIPEKVRALPLELLQLANHYYYQHIYGADGEPLMYTALLRELQESRYAELTTTQQETAYVLSGEWRGTIQGLVETARTI